VTVGRDGARATAVIVGLCLLVGAVWALLPRMLGAAGGPEPEVIAAFRTAELTRAPIAVAGAPPFELSLLWQRAALLSGSAAGDLGSLVVPADRDRALGDARIDSVLRLPGHRWEPRAWYLRSERGEVLVTEEAVLSSSSREPEPRTGRLRLVSSGEVGSFVFAGGLL